MKKYFPTMSLYDYNIKSHCCNFQHIYIIKAIHSQFPVPTQPSFEIFAFLLGHPVSIDKKWVREISDILTISSECLYAYGVVNVQKKCQLDIRLSDRRQISDMGTCLFCVKGLILIVLFSSTIVFIYYTEQRYDKRNETQL